MEELTTGSFAEVLDDPAGRTGTDGVVPSAFAGVTTIDPAVVERVVLCTGKVAFDVLSRREELLAGKGELPDPGIDPAAVAVVRVEQLYPWPQERLGALLDRYPSARQVTWLQEEPENMGAWSFVHGRLHRLVRDRFALSHVSRAESASPATGSAAMHALEQEDLLRGAFA
jgi:2-oxoglutarate dehydrogenase complex dehydrogenase (E1) component-like enzyme